MNPKVPIRKLVAEVLAELERLNYAENTRNTYRRFYNRLIAFADSIGETAYSEDLGNKYLRTHHSGARVQELTDLLVRDIRLTQPATITLRGKG